MARPSPRSTANHELAALVVLQTCASRPTTMLGVPASWLEAVTVTRPASMGLRQAERPPSVPSQ